jgi:hypothetical protein
MQSINIMKKHHLLLAIATLGLTLMFNAVPASADPHVFETSGATPADIQPTVNAFRAHLGHNNGIGGTFIGGRREINWDGVPDQFAAPNLMPANFFNSNSPRGVEFSTPGTGFRVSGATSDAGAGQPAAALGLAARLSVRAHRFLRHGRRERRRTFRPPDAGIRRGARLDLHLSGPQPDPARPRGDLSRGLRQCDQRRALRRSAPACRPGRATPKPQRTS